MSAISAYLAHGCTRQQVGSMCTKLFNYPSNYMNTLDNYFVLKWDSKYFESHLQGNGVLEIQWTKFSIVYDRCTPTELRIAKICTLSFRQAKEIFNIPPYVLVRKGVHT